MRKTTFGVKTLVGVACSLLILTSCGGDKEDKATTPEGQISTIESMDVGVGRIEAEGTFVSLENAASGDEEDDLFYGSGFVVSDSGIFVTNNHVVAGATKITVSLGHSKKKLDAEVLGASECSDLAVLQLDEDEGPYEYFVWGEDPKVNTDVRAAGFPLGTEEYTLTKGIVSKERADGDQPWASIEKTIETDARINPGNSGGPLVDAETSTIVGVNYAGGTEEDNEGQYFAIAPSIAKDMVDLLKEGDQESLGLNSQVIPLNDDATETGLYVSSVKADSPADEVGIKAGDVVMQLDSKSLGADGTMKDYCEILREEGTDSRLKVRVYRPSEDLIYTGVINSGKKMKEDKELGSTGTSSSASRLSAADYEEVVDDTNTFKVELPKDWSDRQTGGTTSTAGGESAGIVASSNLEDFTQLFENVTAVTAPGVIIYAQTGDTKTPQQLIDGNAASATICPPDDDYIDISDDTVSAMYRTYTCQGGNSLYLLGGIFAESDLSFQIVSVVRSDQDIDKLTHILETLDFAGTA